MIATRTPYRIPLGGGGTDLPSYYSKYGGFLVTAAINKYIYIFVDRRFEKNFRISHHLAIEIKEKTDQLEHPVIRNALALLNITDGIEIVSLADIPPNTGMGSSGSFSVGLLGALHRYKADYISRQELAEEACKLEIDILGRVGGKQDQYAGAFGGIIALEIDRKGKVDVSSVKMPSDAYNELENNILLFYTGIRRDSSDVLKIQSQATEQDDQRTIESLHKIKEIGKESKIALEKGDLRRFAELLDIHWKTKRQVSIQVTTDRIDYLYDIAIRNGALGGKIMGAGGGGFFMFYGEGRSKDQLKKAMEAEGLQYFPFKIDIEGTTILFKSNSD